MKRSKKITIAIVIFFLVFALIIIGRYGVGLYFKKKFSKRPPPGVIVEVVSNKNFSQSLESYCTSLSSKTISYKIKKNDWGISDLDLKGRAAEGSTFKGISFDFNNGDRITITCYYYSDDPVHILKVSMTSNELSRYLEQ